MTARMRQRSHSTVPFEARTTHIYRGYTLRHSAHSGAWDILRHGQKVGQADSLTNAYLTVDQLWHPAKKNPAMKTHVASGTIYSRKPKGRKLTFMMSGPTLEQARNMIRWEGVDPSKEVFVWVSFDDGSQHILQPPFRILSETPKKNPAPRGSVRATRRSVRSYVQSQIPFNASHMYGRKLKDGSYAVFSYGEHWPMFAHVGGVWYENAGRYSRTTTQHRSAAHPHLPTTLMDPDQILRLVREHNPTLPFGVGFSGDRAPIAAFRSLPRARQYGQALATYSRRRTRLMNPDYYVVCLHRLKNGQLRKAGYLTERGSYTTMKRNAMTFNVRSQAKHEAERHASRFPKFAWGVEG